MKTYAVHIGYCSDYDPVRIADVLLRALNEVPLRKPISGNIVIKPNLVMAHPKVATEAYTRREVVEGILAAVCERGRDVRRIDIVEKSGLGVTTASMFRWAGYRELAKRHSVRLRAMEEIRGRSRKGQTAPPRVRGA
jgi:hypothetical protein